MTRMNRSFRATVFAALLAGILFTLPSHAFAAKAAAGAVAAQDSPMAESAAARLNKAQFKDVKVTVENGIATLTGTVSLYEYKMDAGKRVVKAKGVDGVRNLIEVAGPTIPDAELEATLRDRLTYDRIGEVNILHVSNPNMFNAIWVRVQNGVATVGGHARTDRDKDSALAIVATCPGVKDVIGEIEVDPTSLVDDQIRLAVARAIYGFPSLNRYAIDPAMPIRISVQNGNVELYGTVTSSADREVAYMQANRVPGVFSVKNYLNVANQPTEAQK